MTDAPALSWDLPGPFTLEISVQAEDTDRLGHANNVVYIRWLEEVSWLSNATKLSLLRRGKPWSWFRSATGSGAVSGENGAWKYESAASWRDSDSRPR